MRTPTRILSLTGAAALAVTLAACGNVPLSEPAARSAPTTSSNTPNSFPSSSGNFPATTSTQGQQEYGRVTAIEPATTTTGATRRPVNVIGAVVGGLAGAVLGHQIGGGTGRDAATVLGGVAGAAAGSQVGRGQGTPATTTATGAYLITVQTDAGGARTYEVGATGDLRVGDRVRVENGVIYRA